MFNDSDELVKNTLSALQNGDVNLAEEYVNNGLKNYSVDNRFYILSATLAQARGDSQGAFQSLWYALVTEPASQLARSEIFHAVLSDYLAPKDTKKDFSLHSGERQGAEHLHQIRFDHRSRYNFASRWLRNKFGASVYSKLGLDVFCGNGYGSRMITDKTGARMVGLDGSEEAISLAEKYYGSHRTVFGQAIHPFEINFSHFDFVVIFESIEYVNNPDVLLQQMSKASKGPFIISFPDESGLPFDLVGGSFQHHVKHFTRQEMLALLSQVGRTRITAEYGQSVYRIENGVLTGLLPEVQMEPTQSIENPQFRILVAELE